jgi:hypothetical protein
MYGLHMGSPVVCWARHLDMAKSMLVDLWMGTTVS